MTKKRIFAWISVVLATLVVVCLVAAFFVLRSSRFHNYVLAEIRERGQLAIGGKLDIQTWNLQFSPLTVDFNGIVVHGSEPQEAQPLLQADKLTVGFSITSILHRTVHLTEIVIQHPVANVRVDKGGTSNLPTPPKANGSSTSVWDLAVGHTLLSNGEVYYNDQKAQLNADLYDLNTEIHFDALTKRYNGTVSYRNGHVQYAGYSPLTHDLDADFSATPTAATLKSLLFTVGSSQIRVHGDVSDYDNPRVNAAYDIQIHTQDFAELVPTAAPAGDVHLTGSLRYENAANQPLLRTVSVDGEAASSELGAAYQGGNLRVRNLKAQYRLANGNLNVSGIVADLLGGQLASAVQIDRLDETPTGKLNASLKHLSIENARQSVPRRDVRRMPVTGTLDAKVNGAWAGSIKNIGLRAEVALRAAIWNTSVTPKTATPLDAAGHVSYDAKGNTIAIHQAALHIPSTSVIVDGQLSNHSNLQVHAIAGDLHQLALLASSLRGPESEEESIPISGSARIDAVVQGTLRSPQVKGQLQAENLEVRGGQWKTATLGLEANPSSLKIERGSLVSARQGSLNFTATVALKNWSYLPSNQINANVSASDMSLADLEHLANQQYPVTGKLAANIVLQGSQLNPKGHGSLQITKATAYEQPIQNLSVQFQGADDTIHSTLSVALPAGSASGTLSYTPKTKAYQVNLRAPGIVLQKLQAVQAKELPIGGTLTASVSGAGTIDNPQLDATLQIPTLQVRQTAVTEMLAHLVVRNQQANLSLTSKVQPAFIRADATVDLTGEYNARANIDTNKVPLDPFFAVYAPGVPADLHTETELHGSLSGPLKNTSRLEGHLTIATLAGTYQSLQFSNAKPIEVDYRNSEVTLAPAEIRGTEMSLRLQGRVPMKEGAFNAQAQGNVNLRLLGMFNSDLKSSGDIDLDVRAAGTLHQPAVQGTVQVKNAAVSTSATPIGLSKVNGTLDISRDKIQITGLSGEMGGGQISAGGSISYSPSLQFGLAFQGKSIRLLYPDGVRTVLDSNLTFTGNMQAASLSGRALVDSLNFTPDFELTNFAEQFNGISVPRAEETFADHVKLAIAVQSASSLAARSSQVNLEGAANLKVTGTAADPVIVGRVDLTSGELFFLNNRYQLQRGVVTFNDPNTTKPVLNVQVTSTIQQYNVTVTLIGPIDKLTTNYVSDPALPTADVISLIYRGETDEQAAAAGTSTDSFLAGQAASQFSSGVQKLAGISSLQIDPLIGGNNTNPSARIALQQRVTNKLLFTFSTDVTQPQQEIVQGEYQINKRWSVSVARDELGGISVDGRLHTRF